METTHQPIEPFECRLEQGQKKLDPCSFVIFGASGDLTARKLIPALYNLYREERLPPHVRIIGCARRQKTDETWRAELRAAVGGFSPRQPVDDAVWSEFAANISYCQGDITDPATYQRLKHRILSAAIPSLRHNLLFYLATLPSQFGIVVEQLHRVNLLQKEPEVGWQRVVVEKPFGHDLRSARHLNEQLLRYATEQQILRIDHFLGKETVQNIVALRFSNAVFERLWNRETIDHVQITVTESAGIGRRGGYYEQAGALRDMVQNHLLQVLALVAMEPPVSLEPEAVRDEKVKLLKAVRPIAPDEIELSVARGQYTAGEVGGKMQPGYREEHNVDPNSNVETYVALRLFIDNWRWAGVPFYLRTGKRMLCDASEVRVQFRRAPEVLFAARCGPRLDANALVLHLQPEEGITLFVNGKVPGASLTLRPVRLQFKYETEFGAYTPEAYERLLLDAIAGDTTLFLRHDEVEAAWQIVDPIIQVWAGKPLHQNEFYRAGTWGPAAADELLTRAGHAWRNPRPCMGVNDG